MDVTKLTIAEARKALDAKEFSACELVEAYLDAVAAKDQDIHAYLETWGEAARAEARAADLRIARGESAPLTGIPLAVKDNILIEGRIASASSKILEKYVASYDATAVEKLKAQGAVFLGRTNMDEFAMGSSTENSAFGPTKNPHDLSRVPGGSSGGSAAAVAANMALGALGSDTGGSVRQPASFCGVVGLKPTYGAVSRFGLMAMGSSLDQIGPLGKTVADTRSLFEVIRGRDPKDSTSEDAGGVSTSKTSMKIGVPRAFLKEGIDHEVLGRFEAALDFLRSRGHEIIDIEMPDIAHSLAVYYIVMPAEASTNLARYDGIRYGLSIPVPDIESVYARTRGAGFGPEVRRRILIGTFVLSAGYADAYYRKARAVRGVIRAEFDRAFKQVDVVATPTSPTPAFRVGEKADDPLAMYAADIFTVPANLAGVPALSVPIGTVARDGAALPIGLQIIGPHGGENMLFAAGADVERARF